MAAGGQGRRADKAEGGGGQGAFFGTLALGDLVLDLEGTTAYQCEPVHLRLVAGGITDSAIGTAFLKPLSSCTPPFADSIHLVKTDPLPWFP